MMRSVTGATVVAVAALLVCCNADPHQDQAVSANEHTGERFDTVDYSQKEELDDFIRFLWQYENKLENRNGLNGIGGSTLLGRSLQGGRNGLGGIGGSTLLGRDLASGHNKNLNGIGGSSILGRNLDSIGGSTLLGREVENRLHSRFVDSLGGGNFVRNLDSLGGGNFVRNLDSIGGENFVRNLDSIGGHKSRILEPLSGNNLVREVREIRHSGYVPYLISRRYDFGSPYGGRRDSWPLAPVEYRGYFGDGLPKRNFDEIDRSSLDTFVKRNFDEIDRSSMPFPYATKRFYHSSNFDKKMYRQEHPIDEIDFSNLPLDAQRPRSDFPLLPRNLF